MTIAHHPEEELIAAYAAGSLDLGQHVAIATHLAACPDCRAFVRALKGVGGALIAETPPAPVRADALQRALARLSEPPPPPPPPLHPACADAPANLPAFIRRFEFGRWRQVAPRVAMRPIRLPEASPTRVFLLKALAGTKVLEHDHTGFEMTCVLSGGFSHRGGQFGPGDFDFGDSNTRHQPHVDDDEDCVSLIAMQGKLVWKGVVGKLLQPFIRL